MQWQFFKHSNVQIPIITRAHMEEFMFMMAGVGVIALTRGWALVNNRIFVSDNGFRVARSRLGKKRVITQGVGPDGSLPVIEFTGNSEAYRDIWNPERLWKQQWDGQWYVLFYDIPETHRGYRRELRKFLKSLRMGNLQKSVWVSPRPITSAYSDMLTRLRIGKVAIMLEACKTVSEQPDDIIVQRAWNMKEICQWQQHFIRVSQMQINRIKKHKLDAAHVAAYWREHLQAYRNIMEYDPLLPESLWPSFYRGREMFQWHTRITQYISTYLNSIK